MTELHDAPRWVWEEQISFTREKLAERAKAASEGDEFAAQAKGESEFVLRYLLKGYAEKFGTDYPLPPEE